MDRWMIGFRFGGIYIQCSVCIKYPNDWICISYWFLVVLPIDQSSSAVACFFSASGEIDCWASEPTILRHCPLEHKISKSLALLGRPSFSPSIWGRICGAPDLVIYLAEPLRRKRIFPFLSFSMWVILILCMFFIFSCFCFPSKSLLTRVRILAWLSGHVPRFVLQTTNGPIFTSEEGSLYYTGFVFGKLSIRVHPVQKLVQNNAPHL